MYRYKTNIIIIYTCTAQLSVKELYILMKRANGASGGEMEERRSIELNVLYRYES